MFITPGQSSIKKPTGHEKDSITGIPLPPPRRSLVETRADVWERHNMEKIRKRYILISALINTQEWTSQFQVLKFMKHLH